MLSIRVHHAGHKALFILHLIRFFLWLSAYLHRTQRNTGLAEARWSNMSAP
uniref:Transposase n=1 Tax=Mesocestoides corti TaxID=53468 RepID=A0A5K3FIT2_MESCO